jgi:hypothetical protein
VDEQRLERDRLAGRAIERTKDASHAAGSHLAVDREAVENHDAWTETLHDRPFYGSPSRSCGVV